MKLLMEPVPHHVNRINLFSFSFHSSFPNYFLWGRFYVDIQFTPPPSIWELGPMNFEVL